ncbi:MAG: YbfB/YjiJ family MFS transporter [Acetobacteraceae bacterium]
MRAAEMGELRWMTRESGSPKVWRMALSGLCASLVGVGLARFAYTPLLPEMIGAHWFRPAAADYLAAANLTGYLAGAVLAAPLSERVRAVVLLRAMLLVAAASFFACASPLTFSWFFLWRLLSGVAGGIIMVLAAPTILAHVDAARRGLVAGAIIVGVGAGIVISAVLVPGLLAWGLAQTWRALGAAALLLSIVAWNGWPAEGGARARHARGRSPGAVGSRALVALYCEYGLNAVGFVAHMVFLVDFVARGLGKGLAVGSGYWLLFGLSAAVGPVVTGYVADRIGFRLALRIAFVVAVGAVGVLAVNASAIALVVSSVLVGILSPGIVPLVIGRVHELVPDDAGRKAAWGLCTTAFAVGLAAGAYLLSGVFAWSGGAYWLLFLIGAAALLLALAIELLLSPPMSECNESGAGAA